MSSTAPTTLSSEGTWDRGLGAILTATDPNGLESSVTYDGLGRLTSVVAPDVVDCGGASSHSGVSTTHIGYELTTDPVRQPMSRVIPPADTRVISLAWSWDEHGWFEVDYSVSGNMAAMTVHAQCSNGESLCAATGTTEAGQRASLRDNCVCASEQHYVYRWDELNRLAEARRYDRNVATGGVWQAEVRQRYRYDGANARMVKQTLDAEGCGSGTGLVPCERIAVYPYPGDFERRGLTRAFDRYVADASPALRTETQYVVAGARTVFRSPAPGADEP